MITTLRQENSTGVQEADPNIVEEKKPVVWQTEAEYRTERVKDIIGINRQVIAQLLDNLGSEKDEEEKFRYAREDILPKLHKTVNIKEEMKGYKFRGTAAKDEYDFAVSGILGEVCTQITLKSIGFEITETTAEEDLRGIDLFVKPPGQPDNEGFVWAVQIKALKSIDTPLVLDARKKLPAVDTLKDYQYESMDKSNQAMIAMLSKQRNHIYEVHPEFEDHAILPVTIVVPAGSENRVFKKTGEPLPNFPNQLKIAIKQSFPNVEF